MPLRLNVGVSRKIGRPAFPGVGASCQIELDLELDPAILESDLDGFHPRVRSAYLAAHQAVNDEPARLGAAVSVVQAPRPVDAVGPGRGGGAEATAFRHDRPISADANPSVRRLPARSGRSAPSPVRARPTSTLCSATSKSLAPRASPWPRPAASSTRLKAHGAR